MNNYKIVAPQNYHLEDINFIEKFKETINILSSQTNLIFGIKDIYSKHIISTNAYANIVGLKEGKDVSGMFDKEMPCEGTSQYADSYVEEDLSLINTLDVNKHISILNVHHYNDGIKARVFKKDILHCEKSQSILGTIYTGYDIKLSDFMNIIPTYILKFGAIGSLESISNNHIKNNINLTDYEQEICFLLILNWDIKKITLFMNQFRPNKIIRTPDTIIKKKNYICQKLGLNSNTTNDLVEYLISISFHTKMPKSFYCKIIGSHVL